MSNNDLQSKILKYLSEKAHFKQKVYDNTLEVFSTMKDVLREMAADYNDKLEGLDRRVMLEFRDGGKFESQLKVAGDMLMFSMHSNIFEFDREHKVWSLSYIKEDPTLSYCGIINIYNFLSDSFKYKRYDDLGYLIARIFVNREKHFFVEGKRQMGFGVNHLGKSVLDRKTLRNIIETSMAYSMEFDLLVPPYDSVKIASVAMMNKKIETSKQATGKRLGFKFNTDDVAE